jgi:anti-sigma regulatory factor (Ser/Thr protein kinase)
MASRAHGDALFITVPEHKISLVRGMLGAGSANVTLVDMTELGRNPARIIPALLAYASEHRGQRVCCIAEPVWPGRTAPELLEAAKHEALINLAFRDSPVTVICPYDTAGLPGSVIDVAACTHPAVLQDQQEIASDRYLGPDLPSQCDQALPRPPADAEALGYSNDLYPVRSFVASWAERAGLTPERTNDLVLAISELAANSLYHAGGGGMVQVWQTPDELVCQVADGGRITDPLARHRLPPHDLLNGQGLWLVNQVCDLVQARTGPAGTTTRLHMRLHHR